MVLFMDGCSHYATDQLAKKWTAVSAAASGTTTYTIANDGRTDGCIKRVSTSTSESNCGFLTYTPIYTQNDVWTPGATGRIGFAMKVDDLATLGGFATGPTVGTFGRTLLQVQYGGTTSVGVALTSGGIINVYRKCGFGTSPLLGSSIQAIQSGAWTYLEIEWNLSTSATGSIYVRSNNTPVLSIENVANTYDGAGIFANGPALWNSLQFLNLSAATGETSTIRICDLYVADGAAPNGDFLGDISVAYILPDGVGAANAWTPTTGANWECVDGVPPNDTDTPSISATAAGTRDSYSLEDVAGDPTAIQVCIYGRKDAVGACAVRPAFRSGSTYYDSPNELFFADTSFIYKLQPMDVNPATSGSWTKVALDAMQSGPLKST